MQTLTNEQRNNLLTLCEKLESGKYGQTTGQLRKGKNHFCIGGVACDIYQREHPEEAYWSGDRFIINDRETKYIVTPEILEMFGNIDVVPFNLTGLNDGYNISFKDMAMHIRIVANLPDSRYSRFIVGQTVDNKWFGYCVRPCLKYVVPNGIVSVRELREGEVPRDSIYFPNKLSVLEAIKTYRGILND